jgi:hypothetical protein
MDRSDHEPDLDQELEALLARVLERTSGPACRRAEELLASATRPKEPADDRPAEGSGEELPPVDRELLDLHLAGCGECRALAAVLAALAEDLPRLAEVHPAPGFVEGVLTATLPAAVRWRRRWRSVRLESWPRWVRRPRFAWEAAFVLTLVALPIFAAPEAPLQEVPERAIELTRENPLTQLEAPVAELEERLGAAGASLRSSSAARGAARRLVAVEASLTELGHRAEVLAETSRERAGTLFERAASLLESGDETPSANPKD